MTRLVVEGSLAEYYGAAGEAKTNRIRAIFADEAGVATDKVTVVVHATRRRRLQSENAVIIDVTIQCDSPAAAATTRSALASTLGSAEAASSLLATAGVTVTSPPEVRQSTAIIDDDGQLQDQEQDPVSDQKGSAGLPVGAVAGISIGGAAFVAALVALAVCCRRRLCVEVPLPPPDDGWTPPAGGCTSTSTTSLVEIDVIVKSK